MLKLHLNKNLKINRHDYKNENKYNELLNKFDELDFKTKNSLNKKIYFNEKYDKEIFIELSDLLGYQLEKVTKTYQMLTENDINTTLDEIQINIESNHEKISIDSKKEFLTYRKIDVNIFKYEALKEHMETYIELPKKLQKNLLINIKNKDEYCFIWSYIRHINTQEKNLNRIKTEDKKLFTEIYEKVKNFNFPLEINKINIKKIEDNLKINIYILAFDNNDNIIPMFSSENEEDLNLFYYKNHICYIKDLNSYLYSNNKSKKRKYFSNRCLNSFLTQENLGKHKYLCMKYNKRLEKIILPEENSKLEFKKINHMIKSPFTIYFDIETYPQYLKRLNQKNANHEKLLRPYLVSCILKCDYNEKFSKKCQIFTGFNCISKILYNLLTKANDYINDIIEQHFTKEIEDNPDLSKFNKNICHLCNKKIFKKPVKNHCHYSGKMLGFAHNKCNLQYKFPKDNVNNKYLISVFVHNSQNFDNSFLIKVLNIRHKTLNETISFVKS